MRALVFSLFILMAGTAAAQTETTPVETSKVFGDYEIHYNVFPSTMLSESVAAGYNIVRGNNRAVMNVSVRKRVPEGGDRAHPAVVTGSCTDLIQKRPLEFREIREQGDAIYYIAEVRHSDREMLRFDIQVQTDPGAPPRAIRFTRKLYVDE